MPNLVTRSYSTTMSLLRACQQVFPKHGSAIPLASLSRVNYSTSSHPIQSRDLQEKDTTQITTPGEREVMVADVISGAPGDSHPCGPAITTNSDFLKPNCVTVQCGSTSLRGTPCKVVVLKASVGGLIGIFSRVRGDGRTP